MIAVNWGKYMKSSIVCWNIWESLFVLVLAAAPPAMASSIQSAAVPAPRGLHQCPPQSRLSTGLARMASRYGAESYCFVSGHLVHLKSKLKTLDVPIEFGFAYIFGSRGQTSFTTADLDALYSKAKKQWSAVSKTWPHEKSDYENEVNRLLKNDDAEKGNALKATIPRPVLVSMKRISPSAYVVVNIRRQHFSMNKDAINSVQVVGDALVLKGGKLIRLTIERELRTSTDVRKLTSAIDSWTDKVRGES